MSKKLIGKSMLLISVTLFFSIFTLGGFASAQETEKLKYSIKLLEYGKVEKYPISGLIYGAHNEGTQQLPFFYNLIQDNGNNILFDIGFRSGLEDGQKDWIRYINAVEVETPAEVLAKVGLKPEDINKVVLSHLHFDHAGNVDQFPKAHFYLQKSELAGWVSSLALPERVRDWLWLGVDLNHINDLIHVAAEGRLTLIENDKFEITKGIVAHLADGHTFGTQFITVETKKGLFALSQDVVYTYRNAKSYIPNGYGIDNLDMLKALHKVLQTVDGDLSRLVPAHDTEVFSKFPTKQVGKNKIVNIVD
ncbi:MAG: N-acyl homoserine lactonase family protein [Paenibacillus sp.]|nr:N-acyl homoserine lactonase family protein [Paenibacillus sp.]